MRAQNREPVRRTQERAQAWRVREARNRSLCDRRRSGRRRGGCGGRNRSLCDRRRSGRGGRRRGGCGRRSRSLCDGRRRGGRFLCDVRSSRLIAGRPEEHTTDSPAKNLFATVNLFVLKAGALYRAIQCAFWQSNERSLLICGNLFSHHVPRSRVHENYFTNSRDMARRCSLRPLNGMLVEFASAVEAVPIAAG